MNAVRQLRLDLSILTEGPRLGFTLSVQEQLADIGAHHHIIMATDLDCWPLTNNGRETVCWAGPQLL